MRMERLAGIGWIALLAAGGAQGQEQMVAIDLGNSQLAPFAILAQAHATVERIYAGFRNCTDESRAAGVIPKARPQVSQALHQRFVSHRSVRPQLEHQLFLGNHAITMGEQIQQVESFHPGMQHAVWPAKGARFQINFDAVDAKQSGSGNHRIG